MYKDNNTINPGMRQGRYEHLDTAQPYIKSVVVCDSLLSHAVIRKHFGTGLKENVFIDVYVYKTAFKLPC